jgi:hypothetical protein
VIGNFSPAISNALRCAMVLPSFVAGGAISIFVRSDGDDRLPGILMSVLAALGASAIATKAALLARSW